jgi:hypothetical protein
VCSVTLSAIRRSNQGPDEQLGRRGSGDKVTIRDTDTSELAADERPADEHAVEPAAQHVDEQADDGVGDQLEGRPRHRLAISVLIVLILLTLLATNAPDSAIKSALLGAARPFILVTGLDQRWGVFAPNPRTETSNVIARVERADGTVGTYPLDASAGISEYWNYRWLKYGEQLWIGTASDRERAAFARWVADQDRDAGHQPARVALIRITRPNLPPGPGPDAGSWSEVPFFTETVSGR